MFLTKNLLFIHIPKSAGTSVVNVLENSTGGQKIFSIDTHSTFNVFKKNYPDLVQDKKVFCIVRNPFCRFVSIYRFINRDFKLKKWFGGGYQDVKSKIGTFENFINNFIFPEKVWGGNDHFTPQTTWSDNVKHTFRLENPELINKFFRENKIYQDLPLTNNREIPSHTNFMYREYYNSYTKKIIEDKFKSDLEAFNYDF